jgi:glutaredoxin
MRKKRLNKKQCQQKHFEKRCLQRIGKLNDITVLLEMNNIKDVIRSIEVIMRVKL